MRASFSRFVSTEHDLWLVRKQRSIHAALILYVLVVLLIPGGGILGLLQYRYIKKISGIYTKAVVEQEAARCRAEHLQCIAEAASRAKDQFLGIVPHELRTPLSSVLGWTHVLRQSGS
jgi:signal transduction histidine kinase